MELHPQLIERAGKKEFVVLSFEEYQQVTQMLQDYEDLQELREAKEASFGEKGIPLDQAVSQLGL